MKRVLTAIALLAVIVPCCLLGGWWIVGLSSLLLGCSIYELLKTGKGQNWSIAVYIVTIVFALLLFLWSFYITYYNKEADLFAIPSPFIVKDNIILVCSFLIALLIVECLSENFNVNVAFYLFTMTLMISVACQGIIYVRQELGISGIAYLFACSWITDVGGHVVGCKFGKHPLSSVSPKKTVEGAIGGVALSTLVGSIIYAILPFTSFPMHKIVFIFVSALLGLGAVVGDLIFSSIKRQSHIKDFSDLLPGHGGVLDRFDSVIFNTLLFICIYSILVQGIARI